MTLDSIKNRIDLFLKWILVVIMAAMTINVLWQVFSRFILQNPSSFTEELARYMLIWVGILGASYVAGQKMHLAIDLLPSKLKGIIKHFDMLVSGRIHGFVAGVSQFVPTVIINRGFGPISHRNIGFARSVKMEEYIANPHSANDLIEKIQKCWSQKEILRNKLKISIPIVQNQARECFQSVQTIIE